MLTRLVSVEICSRPSTKRFVDAKCGNRSNPESDLRSKHSKSHVLNGGENMVDPTAFKKGREDTSLPGGAVSLESILCTEELQRRPLRPPDYEKENRALVALSGALADSPRSILQTLADTILDVCQADSAGISLLTKDDDGKRFYWPAISGKWKPH